MIIDNNINLRVYKHLEINNAQIYFLFYCKS